MDGETYEIWGRGGGRGLPTRRRVHDGPSVSTKISGLLPHVVTCFEIRVVVVGHSTMSLVVRLICREQHTASSEPRTAEARAASWQAGYVSTWQKGPPCCSVADRLLSYPGAA